MTRLSRTRNQDAGSIQNEIDRVFDRLLSSRDSEKTPSSSQAVWRPRMDLLETEEAYRVRLDMPGMATDDVSISYQDNELTVSGERTTDPRDEDDELVRVERPFGHFRRSFVLPRTVDADNISATHDSGVLTITMPKAEKAKPRQIEIK
ncbi:MAG: Hsp20/alpha crystallin family protein [Salinibacter sp.]|uniref:Hsp20/alpha crystallin family protein n=1 Tax=Salinibacter sp. TaxID=2065818 RepID=UPI0035D50530